MAEKKSEIELIPEELEEARKRKGIFATIRLVGFAILGVSVFAVVVLFALKQAQTASLASVNQKIETEESRIAEMSEVEAQVFGIADKSNALADILSDRNYYSTLLEALEDSTPSGLTITALSTSTEEEEIGVTGEVENYSALATFLRNSVDPKKGGVLFTEIALSSVSYDPSEGKAQFTATLTMKKDGLKGGWEDLLTEEETSEEEEEL